MAFHRFGNEDDGSGIWVNSENVIKMTEVKRRDLDTGSMIYKRILWFNDGSTMELSPEQADALDTTFGIT